MRAFCPPPVVLTRICDVDSYSGIPKRIDVAAPFGLTEPRRDEYEFYDLVDEDARWDKLPRSRGANNVLQLSNESLPVSGPLE